MFCKRLFMLLLPTLFLVGCGADSVNDAKNAATVYLNFQCDWQSVKQAFTPEQKEAWEDVSVEVASDFDDVLASLSDEMEQIRQTTKIPTCQWQFPFKEEGVLTDISVVDTLKFMAQSLLVNARKSFSLKNQSEGINDILSDFRLTRQVGKIESITAKLIQWEIEDSAIALLMFYHEDFDAELRNFLKNELSQLLPTTSAVETLAQEKEWFCYWIQKNFPPENLEEYPFLEDFIAAIDKHPYFSM
ncbi:MAG: hypothetical protein Q4C70_04940 [Planctomycetia bacterium]|nr:hypothetical protein [Planctomycetia bacterium]